MMNQHEILDSCNHNITDMIRHYHDLLQSLQSPNVFGQLPPVFVNNMMVRDSSLREVQIEHIKHKLEQLKDLQSNLLYWMGVGEPPVDISPVENPYTYDTWLLVDSNLGVVKIPKGPDMPKSARQTIGDMYVFYPVSMSNVDMLNAVYEYKKAQASKP